jgi:hypothetical protein
MERREVGGRDVSFTGGISCCGA